MTNTVPSEKPSIPPMTFNELTERCTPAERDELAWVLAMLRARKAWEALRHDARPNAVLGD